MLLAIQAFTELKQHFKLVEESACKGSLLLENKIRKRRPEKISTGHAYL